VAQVLLSQYTARVEKSEKGWEVGVYNIKCSPEFVEFFPCLRGKRLSYQFFHRDQVVADYLPDDWTRTGSTELCSTQGLFQPGRVLTDQGHPELDRCILYYFVEKHLKNGALDKATSKKALKLIERDVTSELAAEVVVRFFES
jgi:GMP synthase-like glutamine amidotransferase